MPRKVYDSKSVGATTILVRLADARRYTSDKPVSAVVSVTIDWGSIAEDLGVKAARSKGKKSRALGSAVDVRLVELIRPDEAPSIPSEAAAPGEAP